MEQGVLYKASELSAEKKRAAETLLGRPLEDDDVLSVRASKGRIIKEASTGQEREKAFDRLFRRIDQAARLAKDIPEEEIEAAIDEAVEHVRHSRE